MAESLKKLKLQICFRCVLYVRIEIDERDLLSNNKQFAGQLYEDKSLALRARDLIFFTTDLQTVNYCTTIHC